MLVALTSLAALMAAQDFVPRDFVPFMTFTRSPSQVGDDVSVEVGVLRGEGRLQFWFRKIVERDGEGDILWTDTQRCPAARDAVVASTQIAPPRVLVPGIPVRPDGSIILSMDGVEYSLRSSAHYDSYGGHELYFTSNVDTPLANWVEGSLATLEECWSEDAPQHGEEDQPVEAQPSPE
ncbi:hypothetical protein [Aurantiacibacter sp. D1-12]|uniref:hypothetical protein n=1 Tax=Aurantiacibacter sp. D1-12 TaxID=2993658 RepID=UPI00237C9DA6|nr:hypothetical protein [Aurantiacibacter sp. D1-12]MDE1467316.1 hypothetical protein [Aurantiacibacter sp. D1-12]